MLKLLYKRNKNFNAVIKKSNPPPMRAFFAHISHKFSFRIYIILIVTLLSVGGFGYYFLLSDQFTIQTVTIEGASGQLAEGIQGHINKQILVKRWLFFTTNTFLFPTSSFIADLLEVYPKIEKAIIKVEAPNGILITISERVVTGIWCAYGDVEHTITPTCYFYDKHGVIYESAPNFTRGSLIMLIRDERFNASELGSTVLEEDTRDFIEKLLAALSLAYVKPSYLTIVSSEEIRVGFPLTSGDNRVSWEVYFSRSHTIVGQVENMILVLEEEIKERAIELAYIDLRLGNKVFYKFIDGEE